MMGARIVQYACAHLMKDCGRLVAITTVAIVLGGGRWRITRVHTVANTYLFGVEKNILCYIINEQIELFNCYKD
jgi:hypothetical protein